VYVGYICLFLALFSAAGLGICHKVSDLRKCRPSAINVMLFFWASLLFWGYTLGFKVLVQHEDPFPAFGTQAVLVAVGCGICACFGILTFQIGVRYGRISTSWLIVNLSTLVPAVLSLVIYQEWKERIRWQQPAALLLVITSVFLLWRDKVSETEKASQSQSDTPQRAGLDESATVSPMAARGLRAALTEQSED
jgi:drug/metabolite transporter (DMT)-like permease